MARLPQHSILKRHARCVDDPHPITVSTGVLSWLLSHLRERCQMKTVLTKRMVTTLVPGDRPYEVRDAQERGLILRVQPSGHKAWIVSWAHGKRRTLGAVEHVTLEQAREQTRQAVAEYVQTGLPSLGRAKPQSCTLDVYLKEHFAPWAAAELRGGGVRYVGRIRTVFDWLLRKQLVDIESPWRISTTPPPSAIRLGTWTALGIASHSGWTLL